MHLRSHVPLPKIVPLHTMFSKLRVAKPQLIFAYVVHFVAPLTVRRSAANESVVKRMQERVDDTRSLSLGTIDQDLCL
jgi:hypothetical protein